MRQIAECEICGGKISRSSGVVNSRDAMERAPWLHLYDKDWVTAPHNGRPVAGTEVEYAR